MVQSIGYTVKTNSQEHTCTVKVIELRMRYPCQTTKDRLSDMIIWDATPGIRGVFQLDDFSMWQWPSENRSDLRPLQCVFSLDVSRYTHLVVGKINSTCYNMSAPRYTYLEYDNAAAAYVNKTVYQNYTCQVNGMVNQTVPSRAVMIIYGGFGGARKGNYAVAAKLVNYMDDTWKYDLTTLKWYCRLVSHSGNRMLQGENESMDGRWDWTRSTERTFRYSVSGFHVHLRWTDSRVKTDP